MSAATDPQPQYAPGDPVLVESVYVCTWARGGIAVHPATDGGHRNVYSVPPADVHPVPPTPDPRDTAIAAVRAIPDDDSFSHYPEASAWVDGYNSALERVREALDGVVPVPAPPAPTPTGWTAVRVPGGRIVARYPNGDDYALTYDDVTDEGVRQRIYAAQAVLALRAEEAAAAAPATTDDDRAEVVALCGSTRFRAEFVEANRVLTMQGAIVVGPGVFQHDGDPLTEAEKVRLDVLHLRKIDLADRVHVVDVGGYIGDSTRREIAYAVARGVPVTYLSDAADAHRAEEGA